jgi:glycosyltransferase involved in cell wall biosynthesis
MGIVYSEIAEKSNGGTELLCRRLEREIDPDLMSNFQIIPSRLRGELDETKIRIFWAHDLPGDPESDHLKNDGWRKYHRLVFVSNWQMQAYMAFYRIPWSKCYVIQNAIDPLEPKNKTEGPVRLIYHTTPHRGLAILVPVFKRLSQTYDLHLDVFSSFKLYGWEGRDVEFQNLFDQLNEMPNATYHGSASHDVVREAVSNSDIFAYPSIWQETSCMCLMEAMSAGLLCVHSNLAALPETSANWTMMYPIHEDHKHHAARFHYALENAIKTTKDMPDWTQNQLMGQTGYANLFYNWKYRKLQWEAFLKSLLDEDRSFEKPMFRYSVG